MSSLDMAIEGLSSVVTTCWHSLGKCLTGIVTPCCVVHQIIGRRRPTATNSNEADCHPWLTKQAGRLGLPRLATLSNCRPSKSYQHAPPTPHPYHPTLQPAILSTTEIICSKGFRQYRPGIDVFTSDTWTSTVVLMAV